MKTRERPAVDYLRAFLVTIALLYAFFAGLRTVADFDAGWQLATGRYIVQHHSIFSSDVFSYTAHGNRWLYPPFSGLLLYLLFLTGGYSALSWFSAMVSVAAVGAIVWKGNRWTAALAIVAVPAIVLRTAPRSDMFTTLIFAACAVLLWRYHEGAKIHLWLLPVLMLAWVNLHIGFFAGLGMMAAYLLTELCDLPVAARRTAAVARLRTIAPWILCSLGVTLVNVWGWRIYQAVAWQNAASETFNGYIGEWSGTRLSSASWLQAISWRDPGSADWWLLAVAAVAIVVALSRRSLGPAIVLCAGAYVSFQHNRFQAIFAILVCIIGGSVLSTLWPDHPGDFGRADSSPVIGLDSKLVGKWVLAGLLLGMVGVRTVDLVTDRFYVWSGQLSLFGTGPSWWLPERATQFLREQHLPGNIFNDYNLGGYLTWRIPEYPDYIDGRFLPFGSQFFAHHRMLMGLSLDSPEWRKEADARNIQTVIFSAARFGGLGNFPLQNDCHSQGWAPVYLDGVSIIFVRKNSANASLIEHLGVQCGTNVMWAPAIASNTSSWRSAAERFQYLMNTASIEYLLTRDAEVSANLGEAEKLFSNEPNLHLLRAQLAQAHNQFDEAERQYKIALRLRSTDASWYALAGLYANEHRYAEARDSVLESASMSTADYDRYRALGKLYLLMNQPQNALAAFEKASRKSPFRGATAELGVEFNAKLAEGRAAAYRQMGDRGRALAAQSDAVQLTPENAVRWQQLADLYQAVGRYSEASAARQHVATLQLAQLNSRP